MAMNIESSPPPSQDCHSATDAGSLVYIVDKDSMLGNVIEAFLNQKGLRPKFFTDSETALETLKSDPEKPVLLLTNLLMTRVNGMELIERSKQIDPSLRTLLFTRNADQEVIEEFQEHYSVKPDGFLKDPLLLGILMATVRSLLGSSAQSPGATQPVG